MTGTHPLATVLEQAHAGRFPAADGAWRRLPPWRPGLHAVVAFTGHAVLVVPPDVTDDRLGALGVDGLGGAHHPRVVTALAGRDGWIDSLDVLLAARGRASARAEPVLVERPDLSGHDRVRFADRLRDDVRVLGYCEEHRRSVAVLGRGVAGLTELSLELEPSRRGAGRGTALASDALRSVPPAHLVVAAVAPGNAASLRALLAAGFAPLGSIQLFVPR